MFRAWRPPGTLASTMLAIFVLASPSLAAGSGKGKDGPCNETCVGNVYKLSYKWAGSKK